MPPSTGNASFLQNHHGHIRSQQAREHSTRLWKDITAHVNSMGGAVKTVEQWKKPMEQAPKVLAIMGEGFGNAQTNAVINPFAVMEPYRHHAATHARVPSMPYTRHSQQHPAYLPTHRLAAGSADANANDRPGQQPTRRRHSAHQPGRHCDAPFVPKITTGRGLSSKRSRSWRS